MYPLNFINKILSTYNSNLQAPDRAHKAEGQKVPPKKILVPLKYYIKYSFRSQCLSALSVC